MKSLLFSIETENTVIFGFSTKKLCRSYLIFSGFWRAISQRTKVLLALLLTISYCPKIWNNSKLFFQKCRGQKIGVKSLIIWTIFFYRLSMPVKGVLTPVTPVGMKPKWLYARGGVRNTFQFAYKTRTCKAPPNNWSELINFLK